MTSLYWQKVNRNFFIILLEIVCVSHGGALGVVGGPRAGGADQVRGVQRGGVRDRGRRHARQRAQPCRADQAQPEGDSSWIVDLFSPDLSRG